MANILVVDDEENIRELLAFNLTREGHQVITAADGVSAINKAREGNIDLIILDLMLPGLDGLEVCRRLRAEEATRPIPIIMLTAKSEELDKVVGLEIGADDYVTKPFSPRELIARVKVQLRHQVERAQAQETDRKEFPEEEVVSVGPVTIRPSYFEVTVSGRKVELTPKEFELLYALMRNPGRVLRRDYLLDRVWGYDYPADTRTVDVHVRYLRQKLEDDPANPQFIETVRGVGYRFKEPGAESQFC